MNALSILFSDNYRRDDLSGLTRRRTLSALPIGSRYRLVDFMLSSLVKAGVPNIGMLVNQNYNSLVDHLGWGKDWDLNRKNSGLKIITPMVNDLGKTVAINKFDSLGNSLFYLNEVLQEYVILADSNIIANVDFRDMLKYHIETNADITVAYSYRQPSEKDSQIIFDERGRVYDSLYRMNGHDEVVPTQLKIHILHRDKYKEIIEKGLTLGWEDLMRDYISKNYNKLNVYAYEVKGYSKVINNINDYYSFNMDLLNDNVREELFLSGTEILTRVKDSVPSFYGENSKVSNSVLADGCIIHGTVENSVISRDVIIEEGAVVKNSIIMTKCVIKKDSVIEYTIMDRYSTASEGVKVSGTETAPYIVNKEITI
ncbi:glucose-1-phosphate adenylyltransferase subunit GlgD [Gemelliphila palaticanis]|nr:glucose-1-phosphate adenylyltransferase subunit GlgD [Gemella palaticanis]